MFHFAQHNNNPFDFLSQAMDLFFAKDLKENDVLTNIVYPYYFRLMEFTDKIPVLKKILPKEVRKSGF